MFPTPIQKQSRTAQTAYQALLPIALLFWLMPLLAVAIFSIKPDADFVTGNYWGMPSSFEGWNNYGRVFFESDMPRYLLNSVRDFTVDMGLYNTKTGLVLFHIAFQTGFCTLFMRNFIRALPFELIEAARVEGVSEIRIFWYVVLPLMKPAIAALSVLIFTFIWNDYFWAVVLTQGTDSQPVTAGITSFNAQYRAAYHLMSAGSIVAALPPVAMFFLMQKHFVAGLTLGAVK